MPTKISIQGISGRDKENNYQEYDTFFVIDEDVSEQEAINAAMQAISSTGMKIYRKNGQDTDRITYSYVGVQADQPMIRLQPRDAAGRWQSYADLGRQLWELRGRTGIMSEWVTPTKSQFEAYAKSQGVSFATGLASTKIHTTLSDMQADIKASINRAEWRKPTYPRGQGTGSQRINRTKSNYADQYQQEIDS